MYDLILIAAAVVPAVFLMVKVYQADRLEKEPVGMLIGLLILGVISTSLAGITEELKAENQLEWVRKMNNIRQQAEETVFHDLIDT